MACFITETSRPVNLVFPRPTLSHTCASVRKGRTASTPAGDDPAGAPAALGQVWHGMGANIGAAFRQPSKAPEFRSRLGERGHPAGSFVGLILAQGATRPEAALGGLEARATLLNFGFQAVRNMPCEFFRGSEKSGWNYPRLGKSGADIFQSLERSPPRFPILGKRRRFNLPGRDGV